MDEETTDRPEGWIRPTAETPEPEPDEDEDEPEPEPEPEPPTDQAMEAVWKKIDTKSANYVQGQVALIKQLGTEWFGCPCCNTPGFVEAFNPADERDQQRRLDTFDYFDAAEPDYAAADDRAECQACNGWGQVLSGSKNPQHRVVPCSRCNGTGYTAQLTGVFTTEANGVTGGPQTAPDLLAPDAQAQPDYWGRPPGHRDYGTLPSLVNA